MLLFMDGQGHYTDIAAKYTRIASGDSAWELVPEGRFGNAIRRTNLPGAIGDSYLVLAPRVSRGGPWAPATGGTCGFAVRVNDLNLLAGLLPQTAAHDLFAVVEGSYHHVKVSLTPNGTFLLRGRKKNISGQELLLAQSAEGIQSGTWNYIEFQWVISATAGSFEVRLNGTPVITYTGDTDQGSSTDPPIAFQTVWTAVQFMGFSGLASLGDPEAFTAWFCDFYLADNTAAAGGDISTFLGDGQMITIFPNAAGLAAEWTPFPAAPNFDQVNDKPIHDGDETYVHTLASDMRDCYGFEDIPVGSVILAVHGNLLIRKETGGSARVAPLVGQASTMYIVGPSQGIGTDLYNRYVTAPMDVNPATGQKWTATEINAGQFGVMRTA